MTGFALELAEDGLEAEVSNEDLVADTVDSGDTLIAQTAEEPSSTADDSGDAAAPLVSTVDPATIRPSSSTEDTEMPAKRKDTQELEAPPEAELPGAVAEKVALDEGERHTSSVEDRRTADAVSEKAPPKPKAPPKAKAKAPPKANGERDVTAPKGFDGVNNA